MNIKLKLFSRSAIGTCCYLRSEASDVGGKIYISFVYSFVRRRHCRRKTSSKRHFVTEPYLFAEPLTQLLTSAGSMLLVTEREPPFYHRRAVA